MNREASRNLDESVRTAVQLIDRFGRVHTSLRVSVTDACNIRCRYCMPESVKGFLPQHQLMSFEHIERVVRALSHVGVNKVRLTGGEPLMRSGLPDLVRRLSGIRGLEQIAITTNGMMLQEVMADLKASGLTHLNISLDTLREDTFQRMSRRHGLDRVLAGIETAVASGLPLRLNAVVLRDVNLEDCIPLVRFAVSKGVTIRFIEFMPLDADRSWSQSQVVPGSKLRERLEAEMGPMQEKIGTDASQPSRDYVFLHGKGSVGFIDPVSQPFCGNCNRLRLTADGKFRNCLFGREDWDIMSLLQRGAADTEILDVASRCVEAKHPSHGISEDGFEPPTRAMYQIGG